MTKEKVVWEIVRGIVGGWGHKLVYNGENRWGQSSAQKTSHKCGFQKDILILIKKLKSLKLLGLNWSDVQKTLTILHKFYGTYYVS